MVPIKPPGTDHVAPPRGGVSIYAALTRRTGDEATVVWSVGLVESYLAAAGIMALFSERVFCEFLMTIYARFELTDGIAL